MASIFMASIVMAYIFMAYIVMAYSYGLCSYGLCSYGLKPVDARVLSRATSKIRCCTPDSSGTTYRGTTAITIIGISASPMRMPIARVWACGYSK